MSAGDRRRKLRLFYFGLASVWGFLIGTTAILGALVLVGRPVQPSPQLLVLLLGAALIALGGGVVVAAAYREAAGKSRH